MYTCHFAIAAQACVTFHRPRDERPTGNTVCLPERGSGLDAAIGRRGRPTCARTGTALARGWCPANMQTRYSIVWIRVINSSR